MEDVWLHLPQIARGGVGFQLLIGMAIAILFGLAAMLVAARYGAASTDKPSSANGAVLGIHYLELKEDVSPEAFERFAADEATPVVNEHLPGTQWVVMKGVRGSRVNGYVSVYQFDSEEARNALWNEDGSPTELYTEVWDECSECQEVETRFYEMIEDTGHTDYVEVRGD